LGVSDAAFAFDDEDTGLRDGMSDVLVARFCMAGPAGGACNEGNELIVCDPSAPGERELERLIFPRQPRHDRICLADFFRPIASGQLDVVALQAVTAGEKVTQLMARLEGGHAVEPEQSTLAIIAHHPRPSTSG
jgi:cobalamin-dependent methionine synthase I